MRAWHLLVLSAVLALPLQTARARELTIGLLTQADDERYSAQALQDAYPEAPGGRSAIAAQIAIDDSAFGLQGAGWSGAKLLPMEAADAAGLPAAGVAAVAQAARGKDVVLVNAAAPEDVLRAAQCAPNLLHTLPSQAMEMDALGQFLAARKWGKPLVLAGPSPADQLLRAAFERSARRFGLKPVATKPFKLSNDPRERDLGNVRLLTAERDYDAVVVLDAGGEFARSVPYRTVLPRPVLGSNGLTARAWDALYERNGAPQLNRRFQRKAQRPMTSYDWATWVATRALIEAASLPKASIAQQLQALRSGTQRIERGYEVGQ